ncbi:MAG TPA: hypothetical protein VM764_04075 [Gemmatimonadaceae bacterium]|jgi:hypothetical protein|nr:hypothetical protein [Gemmatimonadaceae bacterium]
MSDEMKGPALVRDDEVTNHLRAIVAPPEDPSYWASLEQRIMARIDRGADEGRWWALSERAYRIGLLVAGLTLIVSGSVYLRSRAVEARMAYESVIETPGVDTPVYARRGPLDN